MPPCIDPAQKRTAWRRQEKQLLERWSAATERYRAIHAELSARPPAQGASAENDALALEAQKALAELEALKRQVARLKREFLSGDRY
jgi:hypothetical protein